MNSFILKYSGEHGKIPLVNDIAVGELAINVTDKKIYTKNLYNEIVLLTSTENSAFITNPSTIYENFTLGTGLNSSSVGPVTIAENVTITLNLNSNWIIQ
ncbi:MAG: hypothetical protein ACOYM1_10245 [Methylovulum sp.]|jgi:hypothetical protein